MGSNFGHQMALLALVTSLQPGGATCIATLHALPWNVLLALSVSIGLVSSSARVTSVKFQKPLSVCQFETTGPIDRTPETPGSAKKSGIRDMKGACKSGQWIHL